MRILQLTICLTFFVFTLHSSAKENVFEPHLSYEWGLGYFDIKDYQLNNKDFEADNEGSMSLAIKYHFTSTVNLSLRYDYTSNGEDSFLLGTGSNRFKEEIKNEIHFYSILGNYQVQLAQELTLELSMGALIGYDRVITSICPDSTPNLLTFLCNYNDSTTSSKSRTRFSPMIGSSLSYKFSKNWGINAGYFASSYNEGLNKVELNVLYRY